MALVMIRQLPNLFLKKPQLFFGSIPRFEPKSNLLPAFSWNLSKPLFTSSVNFKKSSDKSETPVIKSKHKKITDELKPLVNQNESKITESKEIEEIAESSITEITKKTKHKYPQQKRF